MASMHWIMVIYLNVSVPITAINFNTEKACQNAITQFKAIAGGRAICVKK